MGENLGSIVPEGCGCEVSECPEECVAWGEWSDWGPWMPECLDNNDGEEDTLFDDLDIHRPKRFRSRDCFVQAANGDLTDEEVPVSESFGKCLFADKFETEFMEDPIKICEEVDLPAGEIETKV